MTIKRYFFSIYEKGMVEEPDGSMVLYADHAAEMAAAQARIAELTKERDAAHAEVAKLNAQRETMARWLEKYGQHASDCRCWCRAEDPEACDCGLSAALAAGNDRNGVKWDAT
jgi:hypothetical protein